MRLRDIAHSRAGDKGTINMLSLIAYHEKDYALLCEKITPAAVKAHFNTFFDGEVQRYELPQLHALNFVLNGSRQGGVTRSLALDTHGKSLSSYFLEMEC